MKNLVGKYIVGLMFVALFASPFVAHAGFGISPPRILEDKLVRGSKVERTIYIVQAEPTEDVSVQLDIDNSEMNDWMSFSPGKSFVIPKGTQQFPLKIAIKVPQDTKLGIYKTFVRARTVPKVDPNAPGGTVSIALGARLDIDITVGDGVYYAFKINNINFDTIDETDDPRVNVVVENLGNVMAGPEAATFELFNNFADVRLAYVQGIKLRRVDPFITDTVTTDIPIPIKLSPGEYWGTLRLYDQDKLVREYKSIFNVRKVTFMRKYGMYLGIGAVIILILAFFTWRSRRKRRS